MSLDPPLFERSEIGSRERTAGSPDPPVDRAWRGILIAAPRRALYAASAHPAHPAAVPLCLYYKFEFRTPPTPEPMRVIMESQSTGARQEAPLVEVDANPIARRPPGPPRDPATFHPVIMSGYVAYNLVDHVQLSELPGVYTVYVEQRGVRSNTVTIELAPQP